MILTNNGGWGLNLNALIKEISKNQHSVCLKMLILFYFFKHTRFIQSDMESFCRLSLDSYHYSLSIHFLFNCKITSQIIHNFYSGIVALVNEKEMLLGRLTTK